MGIKYANHSSESRTCQTLTALSVQNKNYSGHVIRKDGLIVFNSVFNKALPNKDLLEWQWDVCRMTNLQRWTCGSSPASCYWNAAWNISCSKYTRGSYQIGGRCISNMRAGCSSEKIKIVNSLGISVCLIFVSNYKIGPRVPLTMIIQWGVSNLFKKIYNM